MFWWIIFVVSYWWIIFVVSYWWIKKSKLFYNYSEQLFCQAIKLVFFIFAVVRTEMCDKVVSKERFMLKYCLHIYKTQEICYKSVDASLLRLKLSTSRKHKHSQKVSHWINC